VVSTTFSLFVEINSLKSLQPSGGAGFKGIIFFNFFCIRPVSRMVPVVPVVTDGSLGILRHPHTSSFPQDETGVILLSRHVRASRQEVPHQNPNVPSLSGAGGIIPCTRDVRVPACIQKKAK
jgi:hypothetical protein